MKLSIKSALYAAAITVLSINFAFAQSDKSETPPTPKTDEAKKTTPEHLNIVWVEATSAISGYVDMGYERSLGKHFSVEVAAGVSFKSPVNISSDAFGFAWFNPKVMSDNYWGDKEVRIEGGTYLKSEYTEGNPLQLGSYFMIEPKYFPKGDFLNGFLIGLRLQSLSFTARLPKPDIMASNRLLYSGNLQYSDSETLPVTRSSVDIVPHIGFHKQWKRIIFALEGGVGARFTTLKGYQAASYINPKNGFPIYELNDNYSERIVLPTISAAFKIGYAF